MPECERWGNWLHKPQARQTAADAEDSHVNKVGHSAFTEYELTTTMLGSHKGQYAAAWRVCIHVTRHPNVTRTSAPTCSRPSAWRS